MLEIFQYSFMVRAFIAGLAIAITAPLIGTFLVARRYSLIADSLAHTSLAGIAIGLILGLYPLYTALIVAVIAAIIIDQLRSSRKISGDTSLAIFLSGGLALSIVLISLAKGLNVDPFSYLFGSITTVGPIDLCLVLIMGVIVVLAISILYKQLLYISLDEEGAKVSGLKTKSINTILMIITAITVVLSIRIVGALLIGALMVIPVVTASQISESFKQSLIVSVLLGLISVISGLFIAYYLNLPTGGSIVLLSLLIFGGVALFSKKK